MKDFFDRYIVILWLFCIAGLAIFGGHLSNILIDVGREVYYPEQILSGKVLFKDLFTIYGPLSYQVNAIIYKILTPKLSSLYIAGGICSICIITLIYAISKRFLSKFLSFGIAFLTIIVGICTTSIFNFHFPYSWAMVYGLISFLLSLNLLLQFYESKDLKYLSLSALFAGMSIAFKYDFLMYSAVIMFFIIKYKDIKAFFSFLCVPIISYGILFLQGLNISDILNSAAIVKSMSTSQTLKYFYQNSGVYFHPKALLEDLMLFIKFSSVFSLFIYGSSIFQNRKILSCILISLSIILSLFLLDKHYMFGFLPIFCLIISFANHKKFDTKLSILAVSALSVCLKVFWVLCLESYGTYYISILLILCMAIIFKHLDKKGEKFSSVFLIFIGCAMLSNNLLQYKSASYPIKTNKGTIYTTEQIAKSTNELISNMSNFENGDVLIFPEGLMINFLTDKKSDDFYNSLLPLYTESLGENNIIEHFENTNPKYIILNNWDMKDYYYRYICQDYAHDFCKFINNNYTKTNIIDNGLRYLIFESK